MDRNTARGYGDNDAGTVYDDGAGQSGCESGVSNRNADVGDECLEQRFLMPKLLLLLVVRPVQGLRNSQIQKVQMLRRLIQLCSSS